MALGHRLENAFSGTLSGLSTGASVGTFFGQPGIGAGVGAGAGLLLGLLSDTEQQELEDMYARGEIDPDTEMAIKNMIGRRFEQIRMEQGGRIARAGLHKSSIGERIRSDTDKSEVDSLSRAMLETSFARAQYGQQLKSQRSAGQRAGAASALDTLTNLYGYSQDKQFYNKQLSDTAAPTGSGRVGTWMRDYGRTLPPVGIESNPLSYRSPHGNNNSPTKSIQGAGTRGATPNILNTGFERRL